MVKEVIMKKIVVIVIIRSVGLRGRSAAVVMTAALAGLIGRAAAVTACGDDRDGFAC